MITVYFDTETGGVEPRHPTIQLAAVAVDAEGVEVSSFQQRIAFNPLDCDPAALAMNHYHEDDWKDAPSATVAARNFAAWIRPYQLVTLMSKRTGRPYTVARLAGYNALTFDLPRLKAMFGASFFPCEYLVRDVLQRALFWFDEHPSEPKPDNFKLITVAAAFGIPTDGAHDALADARMSARLYRVISKAW